MLQHLMTDVLLSAADSRSTAASASFNTFVMPRSMNRAHLQRTRSHHGRGRGNWVI